jgi:protein required for attachment to host cells
MKVPHNAHVAIVDGENFIVMRNRGQIFDPKLEHATKPDLSATNFSAGVQHQDEAGQRKGTSTQLDELAHAAAAAEWLNARAIAGEIEEVIVVADPKTLGEMRRHFHSELERKIVSELAKTMTGEPSDRIAKALADA